MAASILVCVDSESSDASGEGTEDSPYYGTITTSSNFQHYDIVNHYFYVGTTFVYEEPVGVPEPSVGNTYSISSGFGLSIEEETGIITGTISQAGTIVINEHNTLLENPRQYTFYAVEPISPFTATSGSGTEDDPYSGTLTTTENLYDADYIPSEIWVETRTEFDVTLWSVVARAIFLEITFSVSDGFGLEIAVDTNSRCLTGTANVPGDCVLTCSPLGIDPDPIWTVTIHIVQTYPDLIFTSLPSEGEIEYSG